MARLHANSRLGASGAVLAGAQRKNHATKRGIFKVCWASFGDGRGMGLSIEGFKFGIGVGSWRSLEHRRS